MSGPIVRIRIDLKHSERQVRRQVDVPIAASLDDLHFIIQAAMGWEDEHLYEFVIREQRYQSPMRLDGYQMRNVRNSLDAHLSDVIDEGIKRFSYIYDFGDNWEHELHLGQVRAAKEGEIYPCLVDASGRCPPEDCGGVWGYAQLIEAVQDPSRKANEETLDRYGLFDPEDVDEPHLRGNLARLARFFEKP